MSLPALALAVVRDDLVHALQAADAVVPGNQVKKVLTNVRLEASEQTLEIGASDNQVHLRAFVRRVRCQTPGVVLVGAKAILAILRESRSPDVHLEVVTLKDSQQLRIKLSDGFYHLPIYPQDEFPSASRYPEAAPAWPVPGPVIEHMIRRTIFAVDKDRSSAVLSGVLCAMNDGTLFMTATDGKVLCEARYRSEELAVLPDMQVVVPAQTISLIQRMIAGHEQAPVAIAVDRGLFFARMVLGTDVPVQVELTSRLVEGVYPAYRNAIPAQSDTAVAFVTSELLSAVRRTALMVTAANKGIVVELNPGQAVLRNFSFSSGSAEIPVPCVYDGATLRVGMNAQYLQEVLKAYGREELVLELNGPGRGMIMRDVDMTFLLMPITLPN